MTTVLVPVVVETKNRTLEETGTVFGGNEVILTQNNTRSSSEKSEKRLSTYQEYNVAKRLSRSTYQEYNVAKRLSRSTYQEYNVASASDKPVEVEVGAAEIYVL